VNNAFYSSPAYVIAARNASLTGSGDRARAKSSTGYDLQSGAAAGSRCGAPKGRASPELALSITAGKASMRHDKVEGEEFSTLGLRTASPRARRGTQRHRAQAFHMRDDGTADGKRAVALELSCSPDAIRAGEDELAAVGLGDRRPMTRATVGRANSARSPRPALTAPRPASCATTSRPAI
jgi:hypothetical protein